MEVSEDGTMSGVADWLFYKIKNQRGRKTNGTLHNRDTYATQRYKLLAKNTLVNKPWIANK